MIPRVPSGESACGPFFHAVQACRRAYYFVTLVHERQVHEKHFHAARASAAPYELRAPGDVFVEIVERASVAPLARGRYGESVSFAAPGVRET